MSDVKSRIGHILKCNILILYNFITKQLCLDFFSQLTTQFARNLILENQMHVFSPSLFLTDPTSTKCIQPDLTDECADSPCQNSGQCVDEGSTYRCECGAGWTGSNCETEIHSHSPGKKAYDETNNRS